VSNRESEPGNSDLSVRKTELVMIFRVLGTMEEDQSYGFESRKEKWQWGVSRFDFLITRTFPSFRKGWWAGTPEHLRSWRSAFWWYNTPNPAISTSESSSDGWNGLKSYSAR